MKSFFKKVWRIKSLKYIAAFLIPAIFVLMMNQSLDNDSWYVLAEGREIVTNGIYHTDVLSMHEGLNITVQNYGFAVLFYLIYLGLGAPGIYAMLLIVNFLVCFFVYKICMVISNRNVNLSLLLMIVTDVILALGFVVTRAQMVSFVIFLGLIYVLELYVKTNKAKYLWWVPILSLLQINLHASLWWMLILVLGVYLVDSIKMPKLHLQGYKTKPLIVASIAAFLAGFINPYGARMITFIFTSYGDSKFHDLVVELQSFSPFADIFSAFVYISIVGVLVLYIFGKSKNVRVRYLLMFFGFLALGLNTLKGMSQFVLTMFFPLALMYKDVRLEKPIEAEKGRNVIIFWVGVLTICIFTVACPVVLCQISDSPSKGAVGALNAIDEDVRGYDDALKIYTAYTGYNDGGYVEFRGYKPYLDPRGEVFLKKNNGKEDVLYEYIDMKNGKVKVEDFLAKYDFDYLLVRKNVDPFYDLDSEEYETIFEDEKEHIKVLKKVGD